MRCPTCSTENAAGARFCQNCGRRLERACPNCSRVVSAEARFCQSCGFDLRSAEAAPLPEPERAPQAQEFAAGERKLVTALFADIVGSTALAEQMDPEDWREIVSAVHTRVGEIVTRYGGTVSQLLGDGVLAYFGAPVAHEDDAERAARAALDIMSALRGFAPGAADVPAVQMRIGINSGLVVVGSLAAGAHVEYQAVGDTINLAARLQSAAEPGVILLAESTVRPIETLFDVADLGELTLKGKAEPVRAYRLLAERKNAPARRGVKGLSAPMVGRERELAGLSAMLDALALGRGGIVAIVGDAGVGKTRLVAEARKQHPAESVAWFASRCLSYTSSAPYHLAAAILRSLIGSGADASGEEMRRALQQAAPALASQASTIYPFLSHLLGLELEGEDAARIAYLPGPALRARYAAAYRRFLEAVTRDKPTTIICEDIHWADASSVDLLLNVLPVVAETPLLFVLLSRPDRTSPGWRLIDQDSDVAGAAITRLHLTPLSENDSRLLVAHLLDIESLPDAVRQSILTKTEGNPFFLEEVIRMLIEQGTLKQIDGRWQVTRAVHTIEIPDTIHGVLVTRLDRLPDEPKRVVQIASVIGRSFEVSVLQAVLARSAGLERTKIDIILPQLVEAQLLRPSPASQGPAYVFRHALTRDAAYQSMLQKQRRRDHLNVARAYEDLAAGPGEDNAGLLARHYAAAGDDTKTLLYATRAGDAAARVYANAEALSFYDLAMQSATRQVGDTQQISHVFLARGRVLEISGQMAAALTSYNDMLALGRSRGDERMQLDALIGMATLHALKVTTLFDSARAEGLAREAEGIARRMADRRTEAKVLWIMQLIHRDDADASASIAYGERALAIARELAWDEQVALTLNDLAVRYGAAGRAQHAVAALQEARVLWDKLGNRPMLAETLANHAMGTYVWQSDGEQALDMLRQSVQINTSIDNLFGLGYAHSLIGMIQSEAGAYDEALEHLSRSRAIAAQTELIVGRILLPALLGALYGRLGQVEQGIAAALPGLALARSALPSALSWPLVTLAHLYISQGDLQAASAAISEGRAALQKGAFTPSQPLDLQIAAASLLAAQGDHAAAVAQIGRAQQVAESLGTSYHLDEALYIKGTALAALGQTAAAREAWRAARQVAEQRNTRPVLWRILTALADQLQVDDTIEAARLRAQARALVTYIADHSGTPDLRASFLAQPDVRALLDAAA